MNREFLELDSAINDACAPIFNLLAGLSDPNAVDDLPNDLRQAVETTFVTMERRFFEIQLTVAVVHDIKYAMAAYADEMVMSSRWQGKYDWMSQPLVVQFFGDTCAGVGFFRRLDQHKENFRSNLAVIQLYYSVLQFGFQGQYRLDGYEKLQAAMTHLQVELDQQIGTVERKLADDSAPENNLTYQLVGKQPYWVMISIGSAILMALVLNYATQTQRAISASAQSISILQAPNLSGFESYLKD